MKMATKYDHITLGRKFRPIVKAAIVAMPDWVRYRDMRGWASEKVTNGGWREAAEALGYDLQGAWNLFRALNPADAVSDANERVNDIQDAVDGVDPATIAHLDASPVARPTEGVASEFEGQDPGTLIAEALAPASAHMTPHLAGLIPGLLAPLAAAAVKPARVVMQVQVKRETITVDRATGEVITAPVTCSVVDTQSLGRAFGVSRSNIPVNLRHAFENTMVGVCDYSSAPTMDPDYAWVAESLSLLAACDVGGMSAWWYGPAGTGKTEGVAQYAAMLRRPFVRIAIDRTTEPADLIGQEVLAKGGGMKWSDGKLTRAFRIPHCVILIDEPTLLRSGTLAVLQTALDTKTIYTSCGETIKAAHGIFIVACDNTAGMGDDTGRYIDTAPVNAAFLDRFGLRFEASYLTPSAEARMLAARTGIDRNVSKTMIDYATLTRQKSCAGELTMGVTPRRLLSWARAVKAGIPSARAFSSAVVQGCAPEDREILLMLEKQTLTSQHDTIDGITRGTIDPYANTAAEPDLDLDGMTPSEVGQTFTASY